MRGIGARAVSAHGSASEQTAHRIHDSFDDGDSSACEILREKFGDCFLEKPESARPSRSALRSTVCPLHHALAFFEPLNFIDELSVASGSSLKMITLDSAAAARRRKSSAYRDVPSPWRNAHRCG